MILSPRAATRVAVFLALVMAIVVCYGAVRRDVRRYPVQLEPCAVVQYRDSQQVCR